MSVNQIERAYRAWPALISTAKNRETITYGQLAHTLGIHHRAVRFVLSVIQDYCLETQLPPLTILIVNSSGLPGAGFIAHDLNDFDEGLKKVWNFRWEDLANPFEFGLEGISYDEFISILTNKPESSEEVYRKIKSRGIKQILFRDALLKAYSKKCAFTKVSFIETLEACHIVPWSMSSDAEKIDVRNGILLNSFHHKLFDNGFVTITEDYKILFHKKILDKKECSEIEKKLTSELSGKLMCLPSKITCYPLAEYIVKHNKISDWEM